MGNEADDAAGATEALRREWDERAVAWRRWAPQWAALTQAATELIGRAARAAPGQRVLDLAGGPGQPALALAALVGPAGAVTATDLAPEMLSIARDIARQRGVTNIDFQPADAQALPFPAASFDAVTCRFGVAHMPDHGRALQEVRRVLVPGGRAAFVVWGPREENPYFTLSEEVIDRHAPPLPAEPSAPGAFTFARSGALSAALREAGFQQIEEERHRITLTWPGPCDEFWEGRCAMSAALSRRLAALAPAQREAVMTAAHEALRPYDESGQVAMPAVVIVASGVQ